MDQAVFTHVQVAGAGATIPMVRLPVREVLLEQVVVRRIENGPSESDDLLDNPLLAFIERQQLAAAVMDNPNGRGETQRFGALRDNECVLGLANAAANDGVHRDVEHRVACEPLELSLQELEAYTRSEVTRWSKVINDAGIAGTQ